MIPDHNLELKKADFLTRVDKIKLQSLVPDSYTRTISVDSKKANRYLDFNSLCAPNASFFRSSSGIFSSSYSF